VTIRQLELIASGLVFEVDVDGVPGSPLVLLLHGFPQTSHSWRHQLPALAAKGYFAAAPNQRGYSPRARPAAVDDYGTHKLLADARGMARALGYSRYHLVGHDWGGQLAWLLAARFPDELNSLTVLSRPHPAAFAEGLKADPAQAERSKHHRAFQDGNAARELLADGAKRLRATLRNQGVADADVDAYLRRLDEFEVLDAAINWYRAAGGLALAEVPAVNVPTMYLWGDHDATVGRHAAEATTKYVTGPYRFEVLPGIGHFLTDQAPDRVTELLLEHLGVQMVPGTT
jgi:pimeloyl-ACP methyl ester carboxylesterase